MKIYCATYIYHTLDENSYSGTSYVGLDKEKAVKSLGFKNLCEIGSEDLIFMLKGKIEKHVEVWEDDKFIEFIYNKLE